MNFRRMLRGTAGAVVLALLLPLAALAQAAPPENENAEEVMSLPPAPAGTVSCFDYYRFGSVQAKLSTPISGVVSGTPITFTGTLENANSYPIVDGALYVKIFKKRNGLNDGNGPEVVDQFFAKGDIVIPANGSAPITFAWKVPSYATSGDYQLATFFTTSRKFNLLGLSFTDDVVGNTVSFSVEGEQAASVAFDKATVTVSGEAYRFASPPPRISSGKPIVVRALIRNTSAEVQRVDVSWTVYQWDALLRENAVQEERMSLSVPARSSIPASITITDSKYPVYLAVGTLSWKDTKSIVNVRASREGVNRTRINFPGITAFPLVAGQEATLFSCLHNSGLDHVVPNGRLELTLTDFEGKLIAEHTYTGDVTGAMMGIAKAFVPRRNYDQLVLDARLYSGNEFIDEAHLVYDCSRIDPSLCIAGGQGEGKNFVSELFQGTNNFIALGVLLLVLIALWYAIRRRATAGFPPPPPSPTL